MKSILAVLCVQIPYLSDSAVILPRTIHSLSYLIHHLQEIYYQKSHENINNPASKGITRKYIKVRILKTSM